MNIKEIKDLHIATESLIVGRELEKAFSNLFLLASRQQYPSFSYKIETLQDNYKNMLYYIFEGIKDPEQKNVYESIRRNMLDINDEITSKLLRPIALDYYYEKQRIALNTKLDFQNLVTEIKKVCDTITLIELMEPGVDKNKKTLELNGQRERISIQILNHLFATGKLDTESYNEYEDFFNTPHIFIREKSQAISMITLSLLAMFDINKIKLLLTQSLNENQMISSRALVGLVIMLQLYKNRLNLYPEIQYQLAILSENQQVTKTIQTIILQLIRARDTERISKKMTDEIIPQMMKFSKLSGNKMNIDDLMKDNDFLDQNPEWKKELQNSGLEKKLQEYSEMQSEGVDVFHSTFSSLKTFPFFNELSNWFMPFDRQHTSVNELFPEKSRNSILNIAVFESTHMCNSDKYSFCLSIMQAPQSHRDLMLNNFGAEAEQIKNIQQEKKLFNVQQQEEILCNQYIQDLYRFFKLSKRKNNFCDIFQLELNFHDNNLFSYFISSQETLLEMANYCFDKNLFHVALNIYKELIANEYNSASIWQRKAYCEQLLNENDQALVSYLRADLLDPDKQWTLKRIAQLYRSTGNPAKALEYFKRLSQLNPNNMNIILSIGHCYYEMKEYQKALNNYYKVEFMDNTSSKTSRAIAWISFLLDKYETAEKYYIQIIEKNATVQDYLNAGHVQMVTNNIKKALEYYTSAFKLLESPDEFTKMLHEDFNILKEKGVDKDIYYYLNDKIKLASIN